MSSVVSALRSGKKHVRISVAALAMLAVSFLILMSLAGSVSASSCSSAPCGCDCSCAYEVKVDDIVLEQTDGTSCGDPAEFCGDGRVRVSAIVGVDFTGVAGCCGGGCGNCYEKEPEVRAELYVDGEYYGSALVKLSSSVHNRVDFSRLIYTSDFPVSSNVEVKVVAKTGCSEDELAESFYVKECKKECGSCDNDLDLECRDCGKCSCDYGVLKVKVEKCAEDKDNKDNKDKLLADASVHVVSVHVAGVGGSDAGLIDYTKTTHYNGYAVFTLRKGEYTVTASHKDYGKGEQTVYVYGGTTKEISLCLPGSCSAGYTGELRCLGDSVQRQYTESDCTKSWKTVEYCQYGCLSGSCVQTVQSTQKTQQVKQAKSTDVAAALVSLNGAYEASACEVRTFSFDVVNIGSVEAEFNLSVTGEGKGLVFVPRSVSLTPNERKSVLAYAYSCNEGDYPFTVTASATFNGEVEATSAGSVLSVVSAEAGAMFNTGLATIVLACSVVIIVLVVWRAKLGMGFRFGFGLGRGRGRRVPEFFRKLGIDVVG